MWEIKLLFLVAARLAPEVVAYLAWIQRRDAQAITDALNRGRGWPVLEAWYRSVQHWFVGSLRREPGKDSKESRNAAAGKISQSQVDPEKGTKFAGEQGAHIQSRTQARSKVNLLMG